MRILIKNIKGLLQVREENFRSPVSGKAMKHLPVIENAWLAIDQGLIAGYGSMDDFPGIADWKDLEVIDAQNKFVLPCWCDSHTHLVFSESREHEFVDRINGLSYEEIAQRGGGILNSADKIKNAGEDELYESAMKRLSEVIKSGTGAIEIKSGYGLSLEAELKMLRVIKRIKDSAPIPVKSTFLGAHAIPAKYKNSREQYIQHIINDMLPEVAKEKLADYCDVFCERGYFTKEETVAILTEAKKLGMAPKVHANQLSNSGGVQAGVEVNAISVDHLEYVDEAEIACLKDSETMPVVLPGAAFFLNLPFPPARKIIDAGLPLAVASDYNPGSSPSGNMNFMLSLLCIQYRMTPEEAINAATINGAHAMNVADILGSITTGKKANLIITKEIPSYSFIPYSFSNSLIETTIINGKIN